MEFLEMDCFPDGATEFPICAEERPNQWSARYLLGHDKVAGWVMADTADGSKKRRYLFEVGWYKGKPFVTVSTADSSNSNSFGDRDGVGRPIREIGGMPRKHREDIRDYALRVAKHMKEKAFEQQDRLCKQFENVAIRVEVDENQTEIGAKLPKRRFAFHEQGWLLVETRSGRRTRLEAICLGAGATLSDAKRAAVERFFVKKAPALRGNRIIDS